MAVEELNPVKRYTADMDELAGMTREDLIEQAGVLAFIMVSQLLDAENSEIKVGLSDEAYKDYGITFNSAAPEFRPNEFIRLQLIKNDKIIVEKRDFKPATIVVMEDGKLVQKEVK